MSHGNTRHTKTVRAVKGATERSGAARTRAIRTPALGGPALDTSTELLTPTRRFWHLAYLPIPLFLGAIAVLWIAKLPGAFDPPSLLLGLNFVFSTLVSLFVAYLIARTFLVRGTPGLLLLGGGVVVWGLAGVAAVGAGRSDANVVVAVHNLCVCLSAACHLAGAFFSLRAERTVRLAGLTLAVGYASAFGAVVLLALAALDGWIPQFFIEGYGGTPVRYWVLASAVAMFVLTAVLLGGAGRRALSGFRYWYTFALLLIATGLLGVMAESSHGSALSWAGRAAQFLGGVYMLIAAIASVRESHVWGISLGEALRDSERRFKVLTAATFEGIAITEAGRFSDANKQLLALLGYSRDELIGMPITDLIPAEDRQRVLLNINKEQESFIEHGALRKDGTRIVVEAHGRTLAYHDRKIRITAIRDITQRKRTEQAWRESEARYRTLTQRLEALMRALPVGVSFSDDVTCQHVTGNPAVLAQFEVRPGDNLSASAPQNDAPGRQVRFFHAGRPVSDAELPLQRAVAENAEIPPLELEVHLPSGRRWFADVSGAPVRDQQGHVIAGVAVTVDITQRKQMELELQRAKETAEAANRAKDEFLAVLSHELRTPLTPVLLAASLLERRRDLPAEVQADLRTIRRSVELEARIIDDLLDLSRIAHGKMKFDFRVTDIHLLARAAAETCGGGEGAAIELDLAAERHYVNADPARIQQVFWNLLNNARKFTPAAGRILLRSSDLPDNRICCARPTCRTTGSGSMSPIPASASNPMLCRESSLRLSRATAGGRDSSVGWGWAWRSAAPLPRRTAGCSAPPAPVRVAAQLSRSNLPRWPR
jgi:PAS domain S-box-containing protein